MSDDPPGPAKFDRETIERRQFTSVQDITGVVPNVNTLDSGTRSLFDVISVRGLSHTPFSNNPSLIVYVDDVPYGGSYSYANQLFGVESVEVARGPQGANVGANAYGGAIYVRNREPGNQWVSQLSAGGGNRERWIGSGYTSGAMVPDNLYLTLAANFTRRDGFLKNLFLNNRPDHEEQIGGRASLKWTPGENWDLRLSVNLDSFRDGAPRVVRLTDDLLNPLDEIPLETRSDLNGKMDQTIDSESLRLAYKGDSYELLSVTARRNWNFNPFLLDTDFSPLPIAIIELQNDQERWTQELRIRSILPDARWQGSLGLFFANSRLEAFRLFTFFGDSESQRWALDENHFALFGQLSFRPVESLRLDAGIRFDYFQQKFDVTLTSPQMNASSIESRQDSFFVSPGIAAHYALTEDTTLYARSALAYKPGGFRPFLLDNQLNEFRRERTFANEIGLQWDGEFTAASLAFFYYRIHDYQVEQYLNPFDLTVVNADEAESLGVELEFETTLWERLALQSAFGYNRIRFIENANPAAGTDFSGNQAPFAPEFNLLLAAEYRQPQGLFARAEGLWTGETFFDQQNSPLFSQTAYGIFNARIGFERPHFALYAFGYNLTDTRYFTFKLPSAFAGTPGVPRTYGVRLSLNFQ
ncbi:MAG: TonB-dependent receptor [Gammaproteobacteria bacterium]